ncbi:ATP-binding protein [Halomonas saccharevitans]|uniref:histidine kinase n=1 Tax=Halomonas saccharevitans TaxID=416872 RepID=A0A1I6XQI4_9GAMM|nr:ATP-binding protein [Halomonas saccharevitans]SFT40426.1 Signal transduction histidine kinase [Halomonas saccharevitans]
MPHYPLRLKLGAIAALLFFAAALVVVGLVAWRQHALSESVGGNAVWHAYKLDRDTVELRSFMARPNPAARRPLLAMRIRLELLYSRLNLLKEGDITRLLAEIDIAGELVAQVESHLDAMDEQLRRLESLDGDARSNLISRLGILGGVTERLIIAINGHLAEATTGERHALQTLYVVLLLLILAMSLAASLVVVFLFRESRDNAAARRELETLSRELEVTAQRAESSSRAKSEFLATVSHEIRTPLNGVIGMSDLLQDQPLPVKARHFADTIHDSAQRLLELINDILDFSKIEAQRLEFEARPFDLDELIDGAVALFVPRAQARGLHLKCELDPRLPTRLVGDAGRLRQVLLNLLSNAIKFTEQGEVRLGVRALGEGSVLFEVVDTGIGIAPESQHQLFEPFQQGDPSTARRFGGTGLGLVISKRLIEAQGGRLAFESEPGRGSRFWFVLTLPKATADEIAADVDVPAAQGGLADARLLVVEDDPVNQQVARAMLERLGCRVSVAEAADVALAWAAREHFDLIFMDVQLPGMDGLEATRRLRARGGWSAEVPVVAMTAGGPSGDQARCLAAGMNGYLTKPLFQQALVALLQRYLPRGASPPAVELPLEEAALSSLEESLGRQGLTALITLYRQQAAEHLAGLEQALADGDTRQVEYLAHRLKGESSSLGASRLAGLAGQVERLGAQERLDEVAVIVSELHRCLAMTLVALEAWSPAD